jgi:arsenate reductase
MAGNRFDVASAGIHPAGLNPLAVETMKEIGIDISGQRSKSLDELRSLDFDFVITVCDRARASCPVFPSSVSTLHWNIMDPAEVHGTAEVRRQAFGRVRDEIAGLIRDFMTAESGGARERLLE